MATTRGDAAKLSADEKAAVKQRAAELRAQAKAEKEGKKAEVDAKAATDAIAAMSGLDQEVAQMIHDVVLSSTTLLPKTWYGFPSYHRDGAIVCFYQPGEKFGTRYGTLGFQDAAKLDDGDMWPTAYAVVGTGGAVRDQVTALVTRAAG
jgi:uncharacterized protein YdhG (YjbR/CyaY superfamily)